MKLVNGSTRASWNRFALEPKCRKIMTSDTPARSAISRVEVPLKPLSANRSRAASSNNCRPRPRTLGVAGWAAVTSTTIATMPPSGHVSGGRQGGFIGNATVQEPHVDRHTDDENYKRQPDSDDAVPGERPGLHVDRQHPARADHGDPDVEVGRPAGPDRMRSVVDEAADGHADELHRVGGDEHRPYQPAVVVEGANDFGADLGPEAGQQPQQADDLEERGQDDRAAVLDGRQQ